MFQATIFYLFIRRAFPAVGWSAKRIYNIVDDMQDKKQFQMVHKEQVL